jgi:hypothetical protein
MQTDMQMDLRLCTEYSHLTSLLKRRVWWTHYLKMNMLTDLQIRIEHWYLRPLLKKRECMHILLKDEYADRWICEFALSIHI